MNRSFGYSIVRMLMAVEVVLRNVQLYKAQLIAKRTNWADPYFADFKTRVNTAFQTIVGVKSSDDLVNATKVLKAILGPAVDALKDFKNQLKINYKKDKTAHALLLNKFEFNTYYKKASRANQLAVISLLYSIKNNLSDEIKAEMITKGTPAVMIDTLTAFADTLREANVTQEQFKISSKVLTTEKIIELNEIYDTAMDICLIGKSISKDPAVKEMFTFSKIAQNIDVIDVEEVDDPVPVPA